MWRGQESVKAQIRRAANTPFPPGLYSTRWKALNGSLENQFRASDLRSDQVNTPTCKTKEWVCCISRLLLVQLSVGRPICSDEGEFKGTPRKAITNKPDVPLPAFPLWREVGGRDRVGPSALQQKWIFQFQLVLPWINKQMNNWKEKHK